MNMSVYVRTVDGITTEQMDCFMRLSPIVTDVWMHACRDQRKQSLSWTWHELGTQSSISMVCTWRNHDDRKREGVEAPGSDVRRSDTNIHICISIDICIYIYICRCAY